MADHVGELFQGTIDSAVEAGLFVELDRYMVSGLVRAVELGDDAVLERDRQRWVLPRSGRVFRIGSKLEVSVASVNLARRQIDLTLAEPIVSSSPRQPRAPEPGGPRVARRRRG
jgi:ribonuclease R